MTLCTLRPGSLCLSGPTHLVLFEVGAHPPPLVVGEGVTVLLEEGVDAGYAPVPAVL